MVLTTKSLELRENQLQQSLESTMQQFLREPEEVAKYIAGHRKQSHTIEHNQF